RRGPDRPSAGGARGADEDLAKRRVAGTDIPNDIQVAGGIHGEHREQGVGRTGGRVGDLDQPGQVLPAAGRVQEVERACRVWRADVEVDAVGRAPIAGSATRRLKHLSADLVDRRIAVRTKRGVHRAGTGRHFVARSIDVVETVEAHDPLSPAVRTGTDEVVVGAVNQ